MPVVDPWAVHPVSRPSSRRVAGLAVAAVGCSGAVVRVLPMGPNGRAGAVCLGALSLLLTLSFVGVKPLWGRGATLLGLVAVGALIAHRTIGATPAFVVAASTAAATTAILGDRWWRRRASGRSVPLATAAVIGANVFWARGGGLVVTSAILLGAAAMALARSSTPRWSWWLDAPVHVARFITRVVSRSVLLAAVIPLLYVPGGSILLTRRLAPGPRPSWRGPRRDRGDDLALASYPFTATDRRRAARGHLAGVVLCTVVVIAAVPRFTGAPPDPSATQASTGARTVPTPSDADSADRRLTELPAGSGTDWADDMYAEHAALSFTRNDVEGFEVDDASGRYINVKAGERWTTAPQPCPDCVQHSIWWTGGSAAFGTGQRDDHTIASSLVRIGDADRSPLSIRNFAVPGWTLWQEYRNVEARLESVREAPDLVVFYDGFNDMAATLTSALDGPVDWNTPALVDSDVQVHGGLDRLTDADIDRRLAVNGGQQEVGRRAGLRYASLREAIRRDLANRGIAVMFVFQPDAAGGTATFRALDNPPLGVTNRVTPVRLAFDAIVAAAEREFAPDDVDLRHLLDSRRQSVFFDFVHTNEVGAEAVAATLHPEVVRRLGAAR